MAAAVKVSAVNNLASDSAGVTLFVENSTGLYCLHAAVFGGDVKQVAGLFRRTSDATEHVIDINEKDIHGNTPLHLAVMRGHKDCVLLLLAHGAIVKVKNSQGWTPLAEAISYGDRQIISALLKKLRQQSRESLEARRPALIRGLQELGDFYLELKWDFHSWVPLVSRILPSDICKIYKRGSSIRMDTTLVDFNDMKWERGDISFIFQGDQKMSHSLTVLDNNQHVYQRIRYQESEQEIEDEVDIIMSSDIIAATMPTKNITFSRSRSGWVFKENKTEMIGNFKANYYTVHGLTLESRKRREHLSEEDLIKNKAAMQSLTKGQLVDNSDIPRRQSLVSPPPSSVTWEEYISAPAGSPPMLGRPIVSKHNSKTFKASLAMSDEFPMTIKVLLDVLEVIAPFKHFGKLREFMQTHLPPGFPVKIEIPVFPTVAAKVTFQEFAWQTDIAENKFLIPRHYREDPLHFPDL